MPEECEEKIMRCLLMLLFSTLLFLNGSCGCDTGGVGGGCSWSLWEIVKRLRSCLWRMFKNT